MELLRSALLADVPHGFTTRDGGCSAGPFRGLNLGDLVGDDPAAVAGNWRRLEGATGLAFARVRQVHGARVFAAAGPSLPCEEADAVVSTILVLVQDKLVVAGFGPSEPVVPNKDAESKRRNRRVEIYVLENEEAAAAAQR